jgi:hypothetical protein
MKLSSVPSGMYFCSMTYACVLTSVMHLLSNKKIEPQPGIVFDKASAKTKNTS